MDKNQTYAKGRNGMKISPYGSPVIGGKPRVGGATRAGGPSDWSNNLRVFKACPRRCEIRYAHCLQIPKQMRILRSSGRT